jgi:two-component system, LytTR family, sensor kinase
MLSQISEFLRSTLESELAAEIPLSQEVSLAERYLAIEQTRLGDRLQVKLEIAHDTLDALVPSLFLQPLVENAVRHGIAPQLERGRHHNSSPASRLSIAGERRKLRFNR